ncbi:hypothetical protein [Sinomonas sp. RB5]
MQHKAGPLNGLSRDMGRQPPYRQTVKVCAACNNGWMSRLDVIAQRALTPLILGNAVSVAIDDQPEIAKWIQKTALTAMLLSSQDQRDAGYGLPPSEYDALYGQRHLKQPLDASRFWLGRYEGPEGFWAVRVTPLAVRVGGLPEPATPQAYLFTIVLGGSSCMG